MSKLILLPAVDVADGQAVRLSQGAAGTEKSFGDPLEAAESFVEQGAEWLHLVDLDAAFGRGENTAVLRRVVDALAGQINIELSGGIRDDASLTRDVVRARRRDSLNRARLAGRVLAHGVDDGGVNQFLRLCRCDRFSWCSERHTERIAECQHRIVRFVPGEPSVLRLLRPAGDARQRRGNRLERRLSIFQDAERACNMRHLRADRIGRYGSALLRIGIVERRALHLAGRLAMEQRATVATPRAGLGERAGFERQFGGFTEPGEPNIG